MRSSESYRLANNFEKSSHLFRCRLSKGTAERWAIWEIWLRLSFISSALWTHWHKSRSRCPGKLGSRQLRPPEGLPRWRCATPWVMLAGRETGRYKHEAPEAGGDFRWAWCAAHPLTDAPDHGARESRARAGQPECRSPAAGGCGKAHPQTGKGRVLPTCAHQRLTLSILCSPCTYWVSENPIWPAQGSVSQGQNPHWLCGGRRGQRKTKELCEAEVKCGGFGDSRALQTHKRTAWNAEPPAAALSRKLITAGCSCIWKTCLWNQTI